MGSSVQQHLNPGELEKKKKSMHINALELKAILFGLKALVTDQDIHLQILFDNTSAVHILNKMGSSHTEVCDSLVQVIWIWPLPSQKPFGYPPLIPGKDNLDADRESREYDLQTEWKLATAIFNEILHHFQMKPDIDLFASRINYQLKPFVSYRPDPEAYAVDAFQLSWQNLSFYAFPPFCIVGRVLQKVQKALLLYQTNPGIPGLQDYL